MEIEDNKDCVKSIESVDYRVFIGDSSSVFESLDQFIQQFYSGRKIFVLVDENTMEHCYPLMMQSVSSLQEVEVLQIPSGEENKTLEVCTQLWLTLKELKANRNSLLINLGGGVIGDMGGFVASTFKRGFDFIQVPTTLLSQVDASVGGKLGVDLEGEKNMVGVFQNPKAVFVNTDFLFTLPGREVKSGFAEVIKHGLIKDEAYFQWLKNAEPADIEWIECVTQSIKIKNEVVMQDPLEKGERKILNFGHTIGHAIETFSLHNDGEDHYLHGEAIVVGMLMEGYLSNQYGDLREHDLKQIIELFKSYFVLKPVDKSLASTLFGLMQSDKKNQNDEVQYVQLQKVGKATHGHYLVISQLEEAIEFYNGIIG